jgi:hypothetical protein
MRTTLTLDADVAEKAKKAAARLGKSFKEVVNAGLRQGLDEMMKPKKGKPYRTIPKLGGLRPGYNLDNIGELLAQIEGENYK